MEKGKNAKIIKKKRKRKVSIFTIFLWLFLITTMSTIVVSSLSQKSALVDISDDNFEISLDMYEDNGSEKKQDITWNATSDTEVKTVTLQVTYRNTDVQKRYEPGELQITLDGIESVKRAQQYSYTLDKVIAADLKSTSTKQYDWSYEYDSTNNLYTFYNNYAIEENTNFEGTIQVTYAIRSKQVGNGVTALMKACLNESVESNEITFTTYTNKKTFKMYNNALKITSYDGLPSDAEDYIWIKYSISQSSQDNNVRNTIRADYFNKLPYLKVKVPSTDCVILDNNMNIISEKNDDYYFVKDGISSDYSTSYRETTTTYVYIGYPKESYKDQTIDTEFVYMGIYQDEEEESILSSQVITSDLSKFEFIYTGDLYGITEKNDYYCEYVNYTNTLNGYETLVSFQHGCNVFYTGKPLTVRIGSDILGITDENSNFSMLDKEDYYLSSIKINFKDFKNGNSTILQEEKYDCAVFIRYRGTDEYVQYGETFKNQSTTKQINFEKEEEIIDWYFEIYDLQEGLNISTNGNTGIKSRYYITRKENVAEVGEIYNFNYLEIYTRNEVGELELQNEVGLDSYNNEFTQNNIAEYDMNTYGKYKQRAYASVSYGSEKLNVELISHYGTSLQKDNINEYFYSRIDFILQKDAFSDTLDTFKGCKMYAILPKGVELNGTEENIIENSNIWTGDYNEYKKILKSDGTNFLSKDEYEEYAKEHMTVYIDKDYKGSGRTYIELILDHIDEPLNLINFVNSEVHLLQLNIPIKVTYDSYIENGAEYEIYGYGTYMDDNVFLAKYSGYNLQDTGVYDSLASDIDHDGNTDETILYDSIKLNIIDAVSTNQDVHVSVKTNLTNDAYLTETQKVSLGEQYEYKLRARTGANSVKDLIIYDNIETALDGTENWKGSFVGVSTEEAEEKGFAPKVYYSESDTTGSLTESSEWKELSYDSAQKLWVAPSGVSNEQIKSICVDLRKGTDGQDKVIAENSIVYATIVMQAPEELPASGNVGSKNMCYTNWRAIDEITGNPIDNIVGINSNKVNVELDTSTITKEISGRKIWEDNENALGLRPANITIKLMQDGTEYAVKTVTEADNWSYTFENVPVYKEGVSEFVYTIEEETVTDYIAEITGNNITNKIDKTEIEVEKKWVGDEGTTRRPEKVTIQLKKAGILLEEKEANASNNWKVTFTNLDKYDDNGEEIVYTVDEKEDLEFYTKTVVGNVITNTFTVPDDKVQIIGVKNWNDNSNEAEKRPTSITLQVKNGTNIVQEQTVTEGMNWQYTFELPKYDSLGNEITYTIDEKETGSKFYVKEKIEGYTVTNKFEVPNETIEITAEKNWNDNNNEANKRPTSVTLQIKNGTNIVQEQVVSEETNWKYTFTNLPKYDRLGNEINYTVDEKEALDFYVKTVEGNVVTNTFEVPGETVEIEAIKTWNDNNNEAQKRPTSVTLQVKNGESVVASQTVTEETNWKYTFTNLPKYNNLGNEITYTVDEKETGSKFYIKEKIEGNTVTNKFEVPNERVQITGTKSWNDNNNEAGKRPTSITLQVKNGQTVVAEQTVIEAMNWQYTFDLPKYDSLGNEIVYTIDEKETGSKFYVKEKVEGYTVTNKFEVPNERVQITGVKSWNDNNNEAGKRPISITLQVKNGQTVVAEQTVAEAMNWQYTFDLPKYDNLGNEIVYTIDEKETGSKFYVKEKIEGYTVTNKFEVPNETVEVTVEKKWNDNDNEAQKRPTSVTLQVKEGEKIVQEQVVTENENWKYTFINLPKYDSLGNEINYTVDEKESLKFYTKGIVGNIITNTFTVPDEKTSITGEKVWDDNNNQAEKRPSRIVLQVKNREEIVVSQTITEANNWKYTFEGLKKYDHLGNEIQYTIDEESTNSIFYQKENTSSTVVTNTFEVPDEKVQIKVQKSWNDNNNKAGKRPTSIVLQVKSNNKVIEEYEVTSNEEWSHTFELPKYDSLGNEIVYTVDEKETPEFYTKTVVGNTVTNTFEVPGETVSITGEKKWNDNNNEAEKRPNNIVLVVKDGNQVVARQEVNEQNNWKYTFTNLPKYDENADEIHYVIDEESTNSIFYQKENTSDTVVTNTFVVPNDKIEIEAEKKWVGDEGTTRRPESITLQIKNGNEVVQEQVVTEKENWKHTFTNLPKYDNLGNEIVYTVDEKETSEFYAKTVLGNVVTNTFTVPDDKIKIVGQKEWQDNENEAGKRPESVTLQVKANGAVVTEAEVNENNLWRYEFTVPKYDEYGNEVEYSIDEREIGNKFYEKIGVEENVVINKFVVPDEKIQIKVQKSWDDNNNEAEKRASSIILQVKDGETIVAEAEVSEETNWEYTFELEKYDRLGDEINYTVDETFESKFYVKNIVGNVITNKFVVPEERITIVGTKEWDDKDNLSGKRPESVILQIKDGENIVSEAEVSEESNWNYEFELAKYDRLGNEIEYSIDEREVESIFYEKEEVENEDMLDQKVVNKFVVPNEQVLIKAVKKWEDNNDEYEKRPSSVVLQVLVGDEVVAEQKVTESDSWSYEFKLPKYDELGNEIEYTVDEKETNKNYEKHIEGNTVINTCIYEPPVDTSDIPVWVYVIVAFLAISGIGIFVMTKNNQKKSKKN